MNQIDIAWMSGIIEGEGCITSDGNTKYLQVWMNDKDVIDRLHAITGMGNIRTRPGTNFIQHGWVVNKKKDLFRLFLAIYPMMGERRQAKISQAVDELYSNVHCTCFHCKTNFVSLDRKRKYCSNLCMKRAGNNCTKGSS